MSFFSCLKCDLKDRCDAMYCMPFSSMKNGVGNVVYFCYALFSVVVRLDATDVDGFYHIAVANVNCSIVVYFGDSERSSSGCVHF